MNGLRLTEAQSELWLAQSITPGKSYVIGEYLEIHGPVDQDVFRDSVYQLINETTSLRLRLIETDSVPKQIVDGENTEPAYVYADFSRDSHPSEAAENWLHRSMEEPSIHLPEICTSWLSSRRLLPLLYFITNTITSLWMGPAYSWSPGGLLRFTAPQLMTRRRSPVGLAIFRKS